MTNLVQLLKAGAEELQLVLSDEAIAKLITYQELLIKWNKVYNLTAVTLPDAIIKKHILDSLSIIKHINNINNINKNIIDIGTGAGLPGIIIAIVAPEIRVTLLDSNSKKTAFLQQVKISLGLNNIEIIHSRVENYSPAVLYNIIISRAFASLREYVSTAGRLLSKDGVIFAMKGKLADSEILEFNQNNENYMISDICKLHVPLLIEDRSLVIIRNININK